MDLLIGVLAFIGGMCVVSTLVLLVLLAGNFWKEQPDDDELTLLVKENESLIEQISKFQAREQSRKLEDIEILDKMF